MFDMLKVTILEIVQHLQPINPVSKIKYKFMLTKASVVLLKVLKCIIEYELINS